MGLRLPKTKGMLRREAAAWLARLQSQRDPEVELKFRRWRELDPAHAEAFERVRRSYERAALLRRSPVAFEQLGDASPRRSGRYALAAAVAALAVLVPAALLVDRAFTLAATNALMLTTRVGEIRQVRLGDGSKVTLDTASRVQVEVGRSHRRARVQQGRARFEIARAGEPFVVEAGGTIVTAEAGVVDVARDEERSRVDVLAGSAELSLSGGDGGARLALAAGTGVTADPAGAIRKHEAARGSDWTSGMLQFDATPLGLAVAQANLYSQRRIILEGGLDRLRVTGAFRAGDTAAFARALAEAFHLSLREAADGSLVLSPGSRPPGRKKNGG